jgi:hypothetical protein
MKTYKNTITKLPENGIFVFGSNTQGRHGKGSALIAKQLFGAIYGQAKGLQGKSYAIITKDISTYPHKQISKEVIIAQIEALYMLAEKATPLDFYIAYTGKGTNLNGYTPQEMANMFNLSYIPSNIVFEEEFAKLFR